MFKNLSNNELLMIVFLVALALYLYSNGDIVEGMKRNKNRLLRLRGRRPRRRRGRRRGRRQ